MFNIGLSEILVVALVSIVILDKNKMPVFIDLIKNIYKYFMIIKSRTKKLLKDAGIEDLYKDCSVEKVNYIVGEDGKLYPSYSNTSQNNDSENSGSR